MAAAIDNDRVMGRVSPHAYLSGRVSPPSSHVLTKAHVLDAIARSSDEGCTLDLSNKNIVDVGEAGADELAQIGRGQDLVDECRVLRIALVGNILSSLPMSFARLSRLRYLTLRSNSFSVFPEVLTTMPSLEILDFSRNRVRGLPTNPGTLVNLRVMSISRNKIRKLPSYLSKFQNLAVLKADHNPIEWPPKNIMEPEEDLEESEVMHRWVKSLKGWLMKNHVEDEKTAPQPADNSVMVATPHVRSCSIESETSVYSTSSLYVNSVEDSKPERPPAIDTENISPTITDGLSVSPESYLPTPDDSLGSADDDTARPLYSVHSRNKSFLREDDRQIRGPGLSVQKSLPDLRMANGQVPPTSQTKPRVTMLEESKKASDESFSLQAESLLASTSEAPLRVRPRRQARQSPHGAMPSISEQRVPSMDYERNSYFRRLSTLPASTISRMTPPALLSVVDSVRGILFAVSQVYQSLQHYTVYAIDERLSSVLLKVLDPASSYMLQLINALDKFDAQSRRGCPPPSICRRVIESCRDNVAMFGKAVGVLALQLKVLASRDDVRYSRQMLLVLFGAMAEISNSWLGITPQLNTVESLLRGERQPPVSSPGLSTPTKTAPFKAHLASHALSSRVQIPPIAEQPEPPPAASPLAFPHTAPAVARAHSAQPHPSIPVAPAMKRPVASEGRSRMNRRHAGSFSVKDVEIGRALPSNNDGSPPSGGVASGSSTPTPRANPVTLRSVLPLSGSIPPSTSTPYPPYLSPGKHSRQGSAQNVATVNGTPQLSFSGPSRSTLDAPVNSSTLVDKEAIDAMSGAVRAAPAVWSVLEEISNEISGAPVDLRDSLAKAQGLTRRLGENIRAIQEGLPGADRKLLREDSHVFVKTVIALSKVVKDYGSAHRLSVQLRGDIAKLTNATQEFVMLLHVSSFAPSTPRSYSPMVSHAALNASAGMHSPSIGNPTAEEQTTNLDVNGAGLSRSRSAQPAANSKLAATATNPAPRSALPYQGGFKIPALPSRLNGGSRLRNGDPPVSLEGGAVDGHVNVNGL
ncbi:RAM signaling pathway protein-domain-containing protein [Phellopilus nigrolimitatus]|nr:RAM signaling pathway protein-domain-containing protein [Phellopilus nigrolimitatus]